MLNKILNRIVANIGLLVSLLILILNLVFIVDMRTIMERANIKNENFFLVLLSILVGIGLVFLVSRLSKKVDKKSKKVKVILIILLLALYTGVSIGWVKWMNVEPVDDSKYVYEIAKSLADNDFKGLKNNFYLGIYHQQIGISVVLALILKLFHTKSYFCIQVVNIICNDITLIFMYFILKKFFKEYKVNDGVYWLLSLTFLPLIMLTSFVYGDYIGMTFTTLGIFFIMKNNEKSEIMYLLLSAFCIAFSIIVKQNYLITFIAITIYLFLNLFTKTDKSFMQKLVGIAIFVFIALSPSKVLDHYMISELQINENNAFPMISYCAMATSESCRGNGWYNDELIQYAYEHVGKKYTYYNDYLDKRISKFENDPGYMFGFFGKKVISLWAEPTYQSLWYNYPLSITRAGGDTESFMKSKSVKDSFYEGAMSTLIMRYQKTIIIVIFSASVIFCFIERKKLPNNASLFIIILLGGFFFHIIWEAKSRYVMPYVIYMIPIATLGISIIINKIDARIDYKRNQELLEKML